MSTARLRKRAPHRRKARRPETARLSAPAAPVASPIEPTPLELAEEELVLLEPAPTTEATPALELTHAVFETPPRENDEDFAETPQERAPLADEPPFDPPDEDDDIFRGRPSSELEDAPE